MQTTQFKISGYLVGPIWMPSTECFKDLAYTFQREQDKPARPFVNTCDDLRDALLTVTNDGDFQHCKVAHGVLTVRRITQGKAGTRITRERSFPLDKFPSIADMTRDDWDGPFTED